MADLKKVDDQMRPRLVINAGSEIEQDTGMSGSSQIKALQVSTY